MAQQCMADKLINTAPIERVAAIRNGEIRLDCGLLLAPIWALALTFLRFGITENGGFFNENQ